MNRLALVAAFAAASAARPAKAKSVIYIFLSGGLAQHESFDMKPDAPDNIRGEFKPIRTATPGMHICEYLPELAKRSSQFALVRSLTHESNEHSQGHHIMLTGRSEIPLGFDPSKPKNKELVGPWSSSLVVPWSARRLNQKVRIVGGSFPERGNARNTSSRYRE